MYFSGTVGNICLIADERSVRITSAFELKLNPSPIVENEYVLSCVAIEKWVGFLLSIDFISR
jgi:hypothetical protein